MSQERKAFYFGCLDQHGHRFHGRPLVVKPNALGEEPVDFPWTIQQADTGLLLDGMHYDVIDGRVWWQFGKASVYPWYAFVWWDRTGDDRPNSNSGFYVTSILEPVDAFKFAISTFPEVSRRQRAPWPLLEQEPKR